MFRIPYPTSSRPAVVGDDAAEAALFHRLPRRGDVVCLDTALLIAGSFVDDAYDIVAKLVSSGRMVVEFEATPRPFPHRRIQVRRL